MVRHLDEYPDFFLVSLLAGQNAVAPSQSSSLVVFALAAVGMFLVIISFAVKRKLLDRSVAFQNVDLVQKALVVACAICEAVALMGLVERFVIRNSDYYLLFLIAAAGTALHFPRREQLEAATYKGSFESPNS